MGKLKKDTIREIWTICILLRDLKCKQDHLIKKLNEISDDILNIYIDEEKEYHSAMVAELRLQGYEISDEVNYNLNDVKKEFSRSKDGISQAMVSKIVKSLKNEGIIEKRYLNEPGRGPSPYEYHLVETVPVLKKILSKFYNPDLNKYFSAFLGNILILSTYTQNLVNIDLIKRIEKDAELYFTDEEKNMIINILRTSPQALKEALNYTGLFANIKHDTPNFQFHHSEEMFLLRLQLKLGEDVLYFPTKNQKQIKYSINVSFDENLEESYISKKVEDNCLQTTIKPKASDLIFEDPLSDTDHSPL